MQVAKIKFSFKATLLIATLGVFGLSVFAQTITGRISGTITDPSGAVVPGVRVTAVNTETKLARTATTDSNGFYVVTNLPVGDYTVTIEQAGFKKSTKTGYTLVADGRLTVDFTLEAGAVTETVEITGAAGETVNSTSGELARVIDTAQVQELALNGRNYLQLTTLIPGAPLLNDDQLGLMTGLATNQPINGNRGNANLLTVDGGFNLDSGSNNSQINNVGIDYIREVNIKTSNFSSEYGRNSGAAINVVTKSGENSFHGSAFEYLRNEKLDANNYFNNARNVERPSLRYNNFGFSFGGPIIKDKFFFFGGIEWKYIRRMTAATAQTLPTRAERSGNFSLRLRGPDNVVGTADDGVLRDPALPANQCVAPTIAGGVVTVPAIRTGCFPNNTIPAGRITADGRAFANVYNVMEGRLASYTDTPTGNNSLTQEPNPFDFRQDILRLDYRFNEKHSIYGRYLHDKYDLIEPFGTFINSPLATIPTNRVRPGYGIQLGYTWLINPTLINDARISTSWNSQRIPPVGENWKRATYGFVYPQLFIGGGRFDEGIPITAIEGFAGYQGPSGSLLSPTTDISFSDTLSIVKGAHTLKTGLLVIRNRKDQNGRSNYTGNVSFATAPSGNPSSTNNGFGDALLGNFRTYSEFDTDPIGFFRFSQVEAFISDSWKANRWLSLEFGVRYQWGLPIYTQANNIVNFDPAFYDPTRAVTVGRTGTIDTSRGGNRFNGLVRAGIGVPTEELGRVPNGASPVVLSVPTGGPRGLYQPQHLFAPRFGFAITPFNDNKTAIRGGFGIFYDRPEGNIIFSQVNIPPYLSSSQFENGNIANIAGGTAAAVAPFADINAINPQLEVPYTMSYSLSIQRELPWGVFGEVAYVGNQARKLIRQPDINQPSFEVLAANQLLPAAARLSVNALRPFKGYSQILMRLSDSTGNYNALQLYAAKRKGNLTFTGSYTWSKALADTSGNGDNLEDPFNRSFNYGPVSFDRRHILVFTYTYRVPFFSKSNGFLYNTLGGWEASGITRWQTGQYLTPNGASLIPGNRRADYVGGEVNVQGADQFLEWFTKAAFVVAPQTRRGNAGVGMIEGPGRYFWDLSLRKRFSITEQIKLEFRGDLFNAFNQTNLNNPNVTVSAGAYGQISSTAPARNVQLGLRLSF